MLYSAPLLLLDYYLGFSATGISCLNVLGAYLALDIHSCDYLLMIIL